MSTSCWLTRRREPGGRKLADEALELARQAGDKRLLAEVLEARSHALWEPDGVHERLELGQEIVELARAAGDETVERHGLFWRFIALMELGRVAEAESVLALYDRGAVAAGDGQQVAMATARHGRLAALRGRFDDVLSISEQVLELGRRSGLADDFRLAGTLRAGRERARHPGDGRARTDLSGAVATDARSLRRGGPGADDRGGRTGTGHVTRTLRAALDRISACAPRAGAHLHASIRTGLACRYDPAPGGPARWHA